jgi:hypothetical protein
LRIQLAKPASGAFDPGSAESGVGHEELSIQVALFDHPGMGKDDPADARRGKFVRGQSAQAANARDQDGSGLQLPLARVADAGDPHLPLVGLAFFRGQRLVRIRH